MIQLEKRFWIYPEVLEFLLEIWLGLNVVLILWHNWNPSGEQLLIDNVMNGYIETVIIIGMLHYLYYVSMNVVRNMFYFD